ncbi:MAG: autotransporter-associated beta strand repeat-containing protein, partial [Thermoguttaceae bacterium]
MTFRLGLLTVAFCLLIVSTSQAATLYWNAPNGGPGTWDTATQLWSTLALGPLNTTWSLGSTDDAVFQNTPGSGLISIATGGVSVHNMTFGVSGYTIQDLPSQTDALSLSGSGNTITVTNATDTATISSVLSGAGFTKLGLGTLVLSGNNTNLTGTVTIGTLNAIDGGVLKVTNSNALGTAAVTITGGFSGSVAGPSTVNPAQLQLSGGITLTNVISIQQKRDGTGSGPGGHLNPPPNGFPASILNVDGNNFIGVDNTTASIHMQANGNETIIESDGGKLTIRGNVVNDGVSGSNPPAERNLILTGTATGEISGKITAGTSTQGIAVFKEGTGTWILSGINDGSAVQYAGSAFWVHNGVLRLTNSSALGASGSAGGVTVASSLYDEPTGVTTPATGRIELAGSITIPKAIALQGRPDATNAQLANYSDSNTISGNILLTQVDANSTNGNGSTYLIQSNSGLLTLGSIQNNSTVAGTRQVNLQGNGTVSGAIGGGSASSPNDISITKGGTGTWTLSGVNTYTGNTTVNGGTLALSSSASVSSSPALTVNSAGILDLSGFSSGYTLPGSQKLMGTGTVKGDVINGASSAIVPGTDGTVGTLTLQNNLTLGNVSGGNIKFDLGTDTLPADNDLLAVTGNLAINGSAGYTNLVINMTGGQLGTGTYKLISYGGSFSGSVNNINLGAMSSSGTTRQSFTLNNNATLKEIDLNVVGSPASLVWKGNLSNTWDRNPAGTLNWLNGGSADKFYDLDSVTFNATGAAQPIVNIAGNWTPGPVLVSAATDYTFTGTGSLIGAMTLTKSGTGKLTIANTGTNTYSGTTTINVGTLQIGNGGANGSIGAGSVVDNATLVFNQSSNYAT